MFVPLGVALATSVIRAPVLAEYSARAREVVARGKPANKIVVAVRVALAVPAVLPVAGFSSRNRSVAVVSGGPILVC